MAQRTAGTVRPGQWGRDGHPSLVGLEDERQIFIFIDFGYRHSDLPVPLFRISFWLNKGRGSLNIQQWGI